MNRWTFLRVQLLGDLLQQHPLPEQRVDLLPPCEVLRQALQAARNSSVEAAHSSLQLGYRQGLKDGSRARLFDMASIETLLWLGYSTRALLLVKAHRDNLDDVREQLVA